MRDNRRKELAAYIAHRGEVSMTELCEAFHVSMNTIRADVASLEKAGTVEKVYGGVRSAMRQEVTMFTLRAQQHTDAKHIIANTAAAQIHDGDTLFIDAGTTTVVTGNIHLLPHAYTHPEVDIVLLPGSFNRRTGSISGVSALEFLGRYHFAKAIMATTGLSADGKLNVSSYMEYEIKRLAMQQSDHHILLCDSSKFGATGLIGYAMLSDMDRLITDAGCPDALKNLCERSGTVLEIAK